MFCSKKDCFYCVNNACVSLSVLSVDKCTRFLPKTQPRARALPHPVNMAALRAQLNTDAPAIGGTRRLSQRQVFI